MSARPGIGSVARCRRRPRPSAGSGPVPIPSTGSGRRRYCPCSKGMPPAGSGRRQLSSALRQAQEEEKFPGRFSVSQLRTLQRRLQALRQAQEAGAERPGPGGLLPPGAHPGARGPAGLHPLQLLESDHRRPSLPPPAVPVGAEPFRVALRRGGHRGDLPGPEAGTPERPVGAGRQPPGDPLGQHLSPDPRDKAQPRPVAERQLRRASGPLWARVHPDQFRRVP